MLPDPQGTSQGLKNGHNVVEEALRRVTLNEFS
jgi:hypothetical protein